MLVTDHHMLICNIGSQLSFLYTEQMVAHLTMNGFNGTLFAHADSLLNNFLLTSNTSTVKERLQGSYQQQLCHFQPLLASCTRQLSVLARAPIYNHTCSLPSTVTRAHCYLLVILTSNP
jgi:hypothetical protein